MKQVTICKLFLCVCVCMSARAWKCSAILVQLAFTQTGNEFLVCEVSIR